MSVKSATARGLSSSLEPGLVLLNTTSFSGVASQSVNNVFSASYDHYKITIAMTSASGTGAQLALRLRANGTDTTTNYGSNAWYINLTQAGSGLEGHVVTYMAVGYVAGASGWSYFSGDILYPNVARQTSLNGIDSRSDGYGTFRSAIQTDSIQFDGFTVYPSNTTPTISGTVSVYGYNK
jgi:hypothetical protein